MDDRDHLERLMRLFERRIPANHVERRFVIARAPRDRAQDSIPTQRLPVFIAYRDS